MEEITKKKTTRWELFQFGMGGFAININNNALIAPFLLYFLTDIAKIPAAMAGSIYLAGKLCQMPFYPIFGTLFDRTKSRWGRYRPYLFFATPIAAIFNVLLFTVPELTTAHKGIYYGGIYILCCILNNPMVGLSCQSLIPVLSADRSTRNFAAMSKQLLGTVAQAGGQAALMPLVIWFGEQTIGWQHTAIAYEIIFILGMWICANGAKRHDIVPETVIKRKPPTLKEQLEVLTVNKPLLFLVLAFFFMVMESSLSWSASIYLYKFIVKEPSLIVKIPATQLIFSIAVGLSLPYLFKSYISKRSFFMLGTALAVVYPLVLLVFRPFENIPLLLGLGVFTQVILAALAITGWATLPDCIDYAEWKTGKRSDALVTSCFSLGTNIGLSFGGFLLGVVLSAVGYVGGTTPTPESLEGIFKFLTIAPIVLTALILLCMKLFPITDSYYNKMIIELNQMRQAKENAQ